METDSELNSNLLQAVVTNDATQVKRLLEEGAHPNYCEDDAEIRPLHFAALYNAPDVVPLLIVAGADIAALTDSDDTPLSIAQSNGNPEVLAVLQKYIHSSDISIEGH